MSKYAKDVERRQRKAMEQGGTEHQIRNRKAKEAIRERLCEYILAEVKTRHIPMAEITAKAQDFPVRQEGKRNRVSAVVVREIVQEMEDKQLVTRYLEGNLVRVAACSRNELDNLFAPVPVMQGSKRKYEMDMFEHTHGGLGSDVYRGYRSYHESANWPSMGGW